MKIQKSSYKKSMGGWVKLCNSCELKKKVGFFEFRKIVVYPQGNVQLELVRLTNGYIAQWLSAMQSRSRVVGSIPAHVNFM